jgi:hypothetical protein
MPATSIRDLVIHEDDLLLGSNGSSIWILDNIAPLRELIKTQKEFIQLFTPSLATRVRDNMFYDTPLPPEEPTGQNPPDGAILDYHLAADASSVQLEILHQDGKVIRSYASDDLPVNVDTTSQRHPTYWMRRVQKLGTSAGHHRFIWDLKYAPPRGAEASYSIAAVYKNTPSGPFGPMVNPGRYRVRLTVDGEVTEKPLVLRMDPRVSISAAALQSQHNLSMACYQAYHELQQMAENIVTQKKPSLTTLALLGTGSPRDQDVLYGSIRAVSPEKETIIGLQNKLIYMMNVLQSADINPTSQAQNGVKYLLDVVVTLKVRLNKGY